MRRLWIVGSLLVVGCAARVTNAPSPVVAATQAIIVPVDESSKHPHGQPPGQDPTFVPPGHGGVPPGQAKKSQEVVGIAAVSSAPGKADDAAGHGDKDKPKAVEKGKKAKGKAKDKK